MPGAPAAPGVIPFIKAIGIKIAAAFGATLAGAGALAVGSAALALSAYSYRRYNGLLDASDVLRPGGGSREFVSRSTEAPRNIAYGTVQVGGTLTFWNSAGTENRDMYIEIAHTGHRIDSYVGWYVGENWVPIADLNDVAIEDIGDQALYQWTLSGSGTSEYYLEALGAGDPGISEPADVIEDSASMSVGTAGSLAAGEWDWADNDTLGYSTVYVRLTDSVDPDSKDDWFLHAEYGDGDVDADTESHGYGTQDGVTQLWLRGHRGGVAQATDVIQDAAFSEIGTTHRHSRCARTNAKLHLMNGFEDIWDGGVLPQDIRPVIKGKLVYDPRLDSTFSGDWGSGSGAHRPSAYLTNGDYEWTLSGSGTSEYYLQAVGGGDPSLSRPGYLWEDLVEMARGTLGSLAAGEWGWGDNDSLGYSVPYVRLSDSTDPDTQGDAYLYADNSHTWAWSDNNALCWADFRTDPFLGPGWDPNRIDYNSVAEAADDCDASVNIPVSTTEARFSCNLVATTADDPQEVIDHILAAMFGQERDYGGQWHVFAGLYESPGTTLTEDDFLDRTPYRHQPQFRDRYNAVRGGYFDPDRVYKYSPFLEVVDSSLRASRDQGQPLYKELRLEAVGGEYLAQRIALLHLNQADQTGLLVVKTGYQAADLRLGDRVSVTHATLGFSAKVFRVVKLVFLPLLGFELTLKEDASAAYSDPSEGAYGQRTAASAITFPRPMRARVPAGLVRDPSFSQALGGLADATKPWYKHVGLSASLTTGETGNALRFPATAASEKGWYRNSHIFEISNREQFKVQTRARRASGFGTLSQLRLGITVLDADGTIVSEADAVIDDTNYSTLMPSTATWYDLAFNIQINDTFTTNRQFGVATVSVVAGSSPYTPQFDLDFVQITRQVP